MTPSLILTSQNQHSKIATQKIKKVLNMKNTVMQQLY